jgi:S-formylglutathione hydrolase FrmB
MRNLLIFVFSLVLTLHLNSQTGKVYDALSHSSKILKEDRNFAIYLPPDYETSQRSYPVLYLLHGAGDDQTGWVQFGEVLHIVDKAIKEGKATPMIIVMPDAQSTNMGYFNLIDGSWNYEDYFFKELMPYVENKYRIKSEKRYRAVAGLSMGGGGSFLYALKHPELFSSACPLSAYIGPENIEVLKDGFENFYKISIPENADLETYFKEHNALEMVKSMDKKTLESVRWYIDCGEEMEAIPGLTGENLCPMS